MNNHLGTMYVNMLDIVVTEFLKNNNIRVNNGSS